MNTPTAPVPALPHLDLPRRAPDSPPPSRAGFATGRVGGVPVALTEPDEAVRWLHRWTVEHRGGIDVRLVNAYSIVAMHDDPTYFELARRGGVSFSDGTPVALVLRALNRAHRVRRVRGPSFFEDSIARGATSGVKEFFLGTTDETLAMLTATVERRWPEAAVAGAWAPPFQDDIDDDYIELCRRMIARSGADRVWIALGTPKQDRVAQLLARVLHVPCIGIGAAFDFTAGTKPEAPRWMQRSGLEWVHRLVSEPHRLWRRYLIGNVRFLLIALRGGH